MTSLFSSHAPATATTMDPDEITKFQEMAAEWWDPQGPVAPLHAMNPCRLEFIMAQIHKHFPKIKGLTVLDVGCGGGLVSEPLARLGAEVTGIDGASDLVAIADHHAHAQNLDITYRTALTAELIREKKQFDVVMALEVIEHVNDATVFIAEISRLVRPGGFVILSTLNRTARAFAFGIFAAERLLRWLPGGTHNWNRFLKPSELHALCMAHNLRPSAITGVVYHPTTGEFNLDPHDVKINYLLSAVKNG